MGNEGQFKPGNKAKKGRESVTAEEIEIRKASINDFIRTWNKWLSVPIGECMRLVGPHGKEEMKELSALEALCVTSIVKAARTGRSDHVDRHLNRLWGKAKESIDLSNADGTLQQKAQVVIFKLPDNGTSDT